MVMNAPGHDYGHARGPEFGNRRRTVAPAPSSSEGAQRRTSKTR